MPEGDTIFRTARSLGRALAGKPVTIFRSTYPLLTRFNDDAPIPGQLVERVELREAKRMHEAALLRHAHACAPLSEAWRASHRPCRCRVHALGAIC